MANKSVYQKLGPRVSEEFQLLAEQKWIIDALAKIKNQRNCLQIERLHLESLKGNVKNFNRNNIPKTSKVKEESIPSTSAVNLMQNVTGKTAEVQNENLKMALTDDVFCNEEALDLVVTNPVYTTNTNADFNIEEDEDEESDDDMLIEMNMLMSGSVK